MVATSQPAADAAASSRPQGWGRMLLIALLLHVPLFAYPVLRLCHWLDLNLGLTLTLLLPLFFSQLIARVYLRRHHARWVLWLRLLADLWLGISPVVLALVLLAELPLALGLLSPVLGAWLVVSVSSVLLLYAMYNAFSPSVIPVALSSSKLQRQLRFVQLSDVHIGSRSSRFLGRVVDAVNRLEPEFVCITGDFIDATGISEQQLSALTRLQMPVYFSIGNHEKYEDLPEILQRLENLGVIILRNRAVSTADLQFIGIDDMDDPYQVRKQLPAIDIDTSKYAILLYHRPRGLAAAAEVGIDLMLSGHTHNGQIVPFNFIVERVFARTKGLFQAGDTWLYVSSGTGTWGPTMRLGTRSEITLFEVEPQSV
ncbi:metallophosphoesterase [Halieaceae bacterium IMCC14734]|uniref:Metallophosphoesterase n=1 Tax=Candidatus Litorirhabdus singularis TaxID=2518993 RepID=A0ABT3TCY9_9GAMM|nr:metallophosphoesterase [Candidatus Litorirhabdus singularis]MCX2980166.1 metallophosphoesterase [Candidatus Litorirhabdus singularis]